MKRASTCLQHHSLPAKKAYSSCGEKLEFRRFVDFHGTTDKSFRTNWGTDLENVSVLGEGVFGTVFEVADAEKKKKFALKLFKAGHTQFGCEDWVRESEIMKSVAAAHHPNLIKLVKSGKMASVPEGYLRIAILMELRGKSLFSVMDSTKSEVPNKEISFPIATIREIGAQILSAMKKLEKMEIVHLDLKPENICFTSTCTFTTEIRKDVCYISPSEELNVCIIDFGNARKSNQEDLKSSEVVQTQNYRAPEIFMGLPFSTRSDVWSFGCILSELYTGELLFYGNDEHDTEQLQFELMQLILQQAPSYLMMRKAAENKKKMICIDGNVYMKKRAKSSFDPPLPLYKQRRRNDRAAIPLFELLERILIFDPTRRLTFSEISSETFFK
ncbi:Protein kinase domain-containing protein [Caenorhabditis elegans]|uniref:Protein kinase domain-containing protein n=1 Tax=Caenorhabditis elegans TaxID=6239 RepID=Q9BHM0_CAEEL|nr:Protein kinase domain-containing protein [Caenorhabditis elegans]CAC35832.2 Protein kinase domain-containing protein [Caenorhabditis elegans]|eukprot:NP_499631.2 Uncharacterized protein CELE_Y111B2A.1 [Caenorhabditis elegans]